jgi:transcriptional regulator with XRE-family HTH domain
MSNFKAIRERLGLNQTEMANKLGCTQGRVWQMDRGGTVMPETAEKLIALARETGQVVTFDDIYGAPRKARARAKAA